MQGIPGGETVNQADKRSRSADFGHSKGQNVVGNRIQALERGVDGVRALYGGVSVEYFLIDLNVGDELLPIPH